MKKQKDEVFVPVTVEKTTQSLEVPMTPEEYRKVSLELCNVIKQKALAVDEKSQIDKRLGDSIKSLEQQIQDMTNVVAAGTLLKSIACQIAYDWEKNTRTVTRLDTLKIINERKITPEERQTKLKLPERKNDDKGSKEVGKGDKGTPGADKSGNPDKK